MITNLHIQSPHTFSPFDSIEQLVHRAKQEGITVLGLTDINTIDGYREFAVVCTKLGVYPLFNVKFALPFDYKKDLINEKQSMNIRFLHGKGLHYPTTLSDDVRNLIASIWKGSQDRIWKIIDICNSVVNKRGFSINLDYNALRSRYAVSSLMEQHLSKAIYNECIATGNNYGNPLAAFRKLFNDPAFNGTIADTTQMQQEITNRFFSAGADAYIEISRNSLLSYFQAKQVILDAGGIPCYQCSADIIDSNHDLVKDPAYLAKQISDKGIYAIEFIPSEFSAQTLSEYMHYFYSHGFCVTVGTIHDSPIKSSLIPTTKEGNRFDNSLLKISYEGACIIAAHQEMHRLKRRGFIDESGKRCITDEELTDFVNLGDDVIRHSQKR